MVEARSRLRCRPQSRCWRGAQPAEQRADAVHAAADGLRAAQRRGELSQETLQGIVELPAGGSSLE